MAGNGKSSNQGCVSASSALRRQEGAKCKSLHNKSRPKLSK